MHDDDRGGIEIGTVGWVDDGGASADLGDSTNDGNTLVRVTLFRGRDPGTKLDQTQAQGQQMLCTLADGVAMPARGTRVIVAVPAKYGMTPGASFILASATNNWKALANAEQGELVIHVPGCPAQIFLRKNGAIVFKTADAKGNTTFLKLAPGVFQLVDPAFSIVADDAGIRMTHWTGAGLMMTGLSGMPSPLSALASMVQINAGMIKVDAPDVRLGPDQDGTATYAPVAYSAGPADPGGTPLASTPNVVAIPMVSSTGVRVVFP